MEGLLEHHVKVPRASPGDHVDDLIQITQWLRQLASFLRTMVTANLIPVNLSSLKLPALVHG